MTSSRQSDLDPEQQAAVEATEHAIAVLAGPGSGKTRTLSFRSRFLLAKDKQANALLLTFTNKAAAEMKARALSESKVPSSRFYASTFHTFCSDVLRAHGDLVGFPKNFEILDASESKTFGNSIARAHSLPPRVYSEWSEARLRRESTTEEVQRFGTLYQREKVREVILDFDDLVVGVADLLETRDDLAQAYAGKYRHILVDEFQDTNAVQSAIVNALSTHASTVSIFADDDQAIFGFAGAEAENIQRFVEASEAKIYPLTTNYRSAESIVNLANTIIKASPGSSGRLMRANRSGGNVSLQVFSSIESEAVSIADDIAKRVTHEKRPADIAVLARSGWRVESLVEALKGKGIPLSDWRGEPFSPLDRRVLAACLSVIKGSLNARQTSNLCEIMGEEEPVGAMDSESFLAKFAGNALAKGLSRMKDLAFEGASPQNIAKAAQSAIAAHDPELGASLVGIVDSVGQFEAFDKDFSLEHLFSELALGSIGRPPTQGGGIKIASIHRTKGLQWKTVYLLGLEEGHHPDRRSIEGGQVEEERRLCFVGVSRAEDNLSMTRCRETGGYSRMPSRFLNEMGIRK